MKADPVSSLLAAAEALRAAARGIETIELADAQARQDFRNLLADIRRSAFLAVTLAAAELRPAIAAALATADRAPARERAPS